MLKLYNAEWCPYCARVRRKLDELKVECDLVEVPRSRSQRDELMEISGQSGVPTLVCEDGTVIADDDDAIIAYLEQRAQE